MLHNVILGIAIPFIGTALGSACVFFMKKELGRNVQRALLGFAGGVMVAASIWVSTTQTSVKPSSAAIASKSVGVTRLLAAEMQYQAKCTCFLISPWPLAFFTKPITSL